MKKLLSLLATVFTLAGCMSTVSPGPDPAVYANETPKLDFFDYFTGRVDGWGYITDLKGKVTARFRVVMDGTRYVEVDDFGDQEHHLRINEKFIFTGGRIKERYWDVVKHHDNLYTASAPDVPGGAAGEAFGNAIRWRYRMKMPAKYGETEVGMIDWMWKIDKSTVAGKIKMTKMGVRVGEMNLFFRKEGE